MHSERAIRTVRQLGRRGLGAIALLGAVALVGTVPVVAPAADVALTLIGAGSISTAGWGWWVLRSLRQLPLELGPSVAYLRVDGHRQYRVRARLGLGRVARHARARVSWVDADDTVHELEASVPAACVVGPFTIVVPDPLGVVGGAGRLAVQLRVRGEGRDWSAGRDYEADALVPGTFGGVRLGRRGLAFSDAEWSDVEG